MFFAHSIEGEEKDAWQPLAAHLEAVSRLSSLHAQKLEQIDWGPSSDCCTIWKMCARSSGLISQAEVRVRTTPPLGARNPEIGSRKRG
jgi:hypothetical protein